MSARVLVVDDIAANVKILEAKLQAAYYTPLTAMNGADCLRIAAAERPDLILLDVMMPGMDGFECCARLKASPVTAHIPVVMVTALDQPSDRLRGLEAGADDFLTKPPVDVALFARVRSLVRLKMMLDELRMRDETFRDLGVDDADLADLGGPVSGRVLVVEPRPGRAKAIREALERRPTLTIDCVDTPGAAFERLRVAPPDVFVSASKVGVVDGLRLCAELRSRPETRQSAAILVVEDGDHETAAAALDLGAGDYVMRPIEPNELVARVIAQIRRKRYADRLRENVHTGMRLAVTDALTGLYNRRYADQHLGRLLAQSRATSAPLSVMGLDIDHFKSVNDRFGHAAGDRVLAEFARRVQAEVRGVDLVARYGGEEFVVMLPETLAAEAMRAGERIRVSVARRPFDLGPGQPPLDVTVSVGVAEWDGPSESGAMLLDRADTALYASKRGGRDRVTLAGRPASASKSVA